MTSGAELPLVWDNLAATSIAASGGRRLGGRRLGASGGRGLGASGGRLLGASGSRRLSASGGGPFTCQPTNQQPTKGFGSFGWLGQVVHYSALLYLV